MLIYKILFINALTNSVLMNNSKEELTLKDK